jgi:hypothetical protein
MVMGPSTAASTDKTQKSDGNIDRDRLVIPIIIPVRYRRFAV